MAYDPTAVYKGVEKYVEQRVKYCDDPNVKLYNDPGDKEIWTEPLWSEKATDPETTLKRLRDRVGKMGIHHGSSRDFCWVADQWNLASNLGESTVCQLANRDSKLSEDIERAALLWMCKEIGYDDNADAFVTPGGNPSQVVVMATIREVMGVDASQTDKLVVYRSYTCHTCVDKGVIVVGLGHVKMQLVPMDDQFRMDVNALKRMIEEDKKAGMKPFLVIASFATFDVGSIDPLDEIAKVSKANKMWFHADASYGCYMILDPDMKAKAKGIEEADSVCIGFNQPYGAHGVLFKRGKDMRASMGASEKNKETLVWSSPIEDKAMPRGFPIWFSVNLMGIEFYRKVSKRNNQLAAYAHSWLKTLPGLEVLPCPSNLAVFRVKGTRADANPKTKQLWELTHQDGRIVIPPTTLDEYLCIRMGINEVRPVYKEVQFALDLIAQKTSELLGPASVQGTRPQMPADCAWIPKFEGEYIAREKELLGHTTKVVMDFARENCFKAAPRTPKRPSMQELWPQEHPVPVEKLLEITKGIQIRDNPKPYSLYAATLGMYLACFTHPNCGVKFSNPATYELETKMLQFLGQKCGFPGCIMGVFANDGRTGNIMPMHSARMSMLPPAAPGQPRPVFYGTAHSIQTFETAVLCIGMGRDISFHELKKHTDQAVDAEELRKAVEEDKKNPGLTPFFLAEVVSKGTIETKDRDAIAQIIKDNNMWHHVDMSGTEPKPLWTLDNKVAVNGVSKIDSISLEVGSKTMQPVDIAAILVPGKDKLRKALVTPRLQQYVVDTVDTTSFAGMFDPYVISSELPKPCRVLTLWFTLMTVGSGNL